MSPLASILVISGYFALLILISFLTRSKGDSDTFFVGNRDSKWYLVAFGMIGASLSGVTFISIPGWVDKTQFTYMQMVLGYLPGYWLIAFVLLPIFYRLNVFSIYQYLEQRFGYYSYKSGAAFFLLSRLIGASFRLYLVAGVLQLAFLDAIGLPFWVSILITILLIWLYTYSGGIRTIVYTDILQTFTMLLAVGLSLWFIFSDLDLSPEELVKKGGEFGLTRVFDWNWKSPTFFFKQFFAGAFIALAMTGLDQDMMQKNLSCKNPIEARKNMLWFSSILVPVNFIFLVLGAGLFLLAYRYQVEIPGRTDDLFPLLALNHMPEMVGIFFLLGITAAAYSSADSALTSLTTSFCIDFLGFAKKSDEKIKRRIRNWVHLGMSAMLFILIFIFRLVQNENVISSLFKAAGFTYGPLLGLFAFGITNKISIKDRFVPYVVLSAPILTYFFQFILTDIVPEYKFGFELLLLNGALTYLGLFLLKSNR
jgi:Na+/proline symporter